MRWGMQSWDYSYNFVTVPEFCPRDFCLAPGNMVLTINPLRILVQTWKILEILSQILCQLVCNWLYMYPRVYSCACAHVQQSQRCIYVYPYIHTRICMSQPHMEELWIQMITNVSISDVFCRSHLMERSVIGTKMLFEILALVIMLI